MMPEFFTSEWFVPEVDNWHLKEGAPKKIVDEFNAFMKKREREDVIVD